MTENKTYIIEKGTRDERIWRDGYDHGRTLTYDSAHSEGRTRGTIEGVIGSVIAAVAVTLSAKVWDRIKNS